MPSFEWYWLLWALGGLFVAFLLLCFLIEMGVVKETITCPSCKSKMEHLPGRDSGATAEALFGCTNEKCGRTQHHGGWGSELKYDAANRAAHRALWAESDAKRNRHR